MNSIKAISSERQRKLGDLAWVSGAVVTRDLPRDTILKRLQIRFSGVTTTTFGSAPTLSEVSTIDNLISRFDVVVNGGRTIKSVRPHLLHMEQLLATQIQGERKGSGAAAAAYANNPLTDGGFAVGTTGQISTVAETVQISFEMWLANKGKQSTYLNLKGASSAELRVSCGTTAGLEKTSVITFTATVFTMELTTIEAQDLPGNLIFSDWKQTTKSVLYSAQQTEATIDINRGNWLAGIKLFLEQDPAGADATAANRRKPQNNGITDIKLMLNGSRVIKQTTFFSLQAENRVRFGLSAPLASSQTRMDGFAYLDVLDDRSLDTALDCRPPDVDNLQLIISTRASDATSNIYPLQITVETGEIVVNS